jgi:hypothetical protein
MGSSLEQFLEKMPDMDYDAFSHLINLLRLVGYLVSGACVFQHACVTLNKGSDNALGQPNTLNLNFKVKKRVWIIKKNCFPIVQNK